MQRGRFEFAGMASKRKRIYGVAAFMRDITNTSHHEFPTPTKRSKLDSGSRSRPRSEKHQENSVLLLQFLPQLLLQFLPQFLLQFLPQFLLQLIPQFLLQFLPQFLLQFFPQFLLQFLPQFLLQFLPQFLLQFLPQLILQFLCLIQPGVVNHFSHPEALDLFLMSQTHCATY